ncbi:amino acid adenylation domain-containing protein [Marinilactibacillus psychrotolerans]|uniref:amino acid adenylation domain-containing protein n=1 Tax=Marinilactibacillus psychrotolerans TaxID=191770 RepID=UPI003888EC76
MENIQKINTLTPMQKGMLFHSLENPNSDAYFVQLQVQLNGDLDANKLNQVLTVLTEKYDVLRSNYFFEKLDQPKQVIFAQKDIQLQFEDISDVQKDKRKVALNDILKNDRQKKFNLKKDNLSRYKVISLTEKEHILLWTFHHVILDGWSMNILVNEMIGLYNGEGIIENEKVKQEHYTDWLESIDREKVENYWKDYLRGYNNTVQFPKFEKADFYKNHKTSQYNFTLSEENSLQLKELGKKLGVSLFCIFQTIWGALLAKYSGEKDIVIGSIHSGREASISDIENLVGNLINTIPLRLNYHRELSEVMKKVQEDMLVSEEIKSLSLSEIQSLSAQKGSLFDHVTVFENYPLNTEKKSNKLSIVSLDSTEETNYPLSIAFHPEKEFRVRVTFNSDMIHPDFISNLENHFKNIAEAIIEKPDVKVNELNLLSEEERNILTDYSNVINISDDYKPIISSLKENTRKYPNKIAIKDGKKAMSYKEFDQITDYYASLFIEKLGSESQDIIAIIGNQSINAAIYMIACFKSGKIYLPIDKEFPIDRIKYILNDAKPGLVIGDQEMEELVKVTCKNTTFLQWKLLKIQDTKKLCREIEIKEEMSAYVIYTSGTTGNPKGVIISHKGISNFIHAAIDEVYCSTSNDKIAQFSNIVFDASIQEMLLSLLSGAELHVLDSAVKHNFENMKNYFFNNQITLVTLPPSYLRELKYKEFPYLRHVTAVGSASSRDIALEWKEKYINGYGPSECSIGSLHYFPNNDLVYSNVPIGRPLKNTFALILDSNKNLSAIGTYGEIYIGGVGVGKGYLNNEELTKSNFIINPLDSKQILYKTGDIGRFNFEGNIEFLGRKDKQIKVRGQRVEVGEIENTIMQSGLIKNTAVLAIQDNGEMKLEAFVVLNGEFKEEELRHFLSKHLPSYMMPTNFYKVDSIPLNQSGKVDEYILNKKKTKDVKSSINQPTSKFEKELQDIWKSILSLDEIPLEANFFEIGGHSLSAIKLISIIQKKLEKKLDIKDVFSFPTIKQLAGLINNRKTTENTTIQPVGNDQEFYETSSAQQRMFILQNFDKSSTMYNVPVIFKVKGVLDVKKLEKAIKHSIKKHEALRTNFLMKNNNIYQTISDNTDFHISRFKIDNEEQDKWQKVQELITPFDLEKDSLIRCAVLEQFDEQSLLFFDFHHIVCDESSIKMFFDEIGKFYSDNSLKEASLQYKDYVNWNLKNQDTRKFIKSEKYWLESLSGELPVLDLPKTSSISEEEQIYRFEVRSSDCQNIKLVSERENITNYMIFLTLFKLVLYKYSKQNDIIVGSPLSGRNHIDTEGIFGLFVNSIAIRSKLDENVTVKELLNSVREKVLEAFEHGEYPFDKLVDKLGIERNKSHNPIFQCMFTYVKGEEDLLQLDGCKNEQLDLDIVESKFDLTFSVKENKETFECGFEFNNKLYSKKLVKQIANHLLKLISELNETLELPIRDLDILPSEEKQIINSTLNEESNNQNNSSSVIEIFEKEVSKHPEAIALEMGESKLNYGQLNDRSNTIAKVLMDKGVNKKDRVGMMLPKNNLDTIPTIIGILKVGATYVPVNPEYPINRINYIIQDSNLNCVICEESKRSELEIVPQDKIISNNDLLSIKHSQNLEVNINSEDLAYIMYTSGTTGEPKGVMINHGNILRLVKDTNYLDFNSQKVFVQSSPLEFDASTFEIWGALLNGSKLICLEYTHPSINDLCELAINKNVTTMFLTTAFFNTIAETNLELFNNLEEVLFGGEKVSPRHVNKANEASCELIHVYGPTENTTFSTYYRVPKTGYLNEVPIGRSVSNSKAMILDESLNMVPNGVKGELYLGGQGLSKGYINKKMLTEEKFISDPYDVNGKLYRTGDYVKVNRDGYIEFIGRTDNQVKIRGKRIELEEIESVLNNHENIERSSVLVWGDNNKFICAYIELKNDTQIIEIENYLDRYLPSYMTPDVIEFVSQINLNTNGKIDKTQFEQPERVKSDDIRVTSNELDIILMDIWRELLGPIMLTKNDDFFRVGGNSLAAIRMVSIIQEKLDTSLTVKDIFEYSTIVDLRNYINTKSENSIEPLPRANREYNSNNFLSSSTQKRLYIHQSKNPNLTQYNMPLIFKIKGTLNLGNLNRAINMLLYKHEPLRTTFKLQGDKLYQHINDYSTRNIEVEFVETLDEAVKCANDEIKPFDLNHELPFRVKIFICSNSDCVLFMDMHHIISDGVSIEVLLKDIEHVYNGGELSNLNSVY